MCILSKCHWRDETISTSCSELTWLEINRICLLEFQQHNVANQCLLNILGTYSHLSATQHLVSIQPFKNNVLHSPAPCHSSHSQDFHEKEEVRSGSIHLHHPICSFYLCRAKSCSSLQSQVSIQKSLFSGSYWHAMRFYYDSMVYIRWAIGLFVCVYTWVIPLPV